MTPNQKKIKKLEQSNDLAGFVIMTLLALLCLAVGYLMGFWEGLAWGY